MYFGSVIPDLHKMKPEISSMSMEQGVKSYGLLEDSTVFVLCQALRRDERHVHNLSLRNQFADQVEPLVQFPVVLFRQAYILRKLHI